MLPVSLCVSPFSTFDVRTLWRTYRSAEIRKPPDPHAGSSTMSCSSGSSISTIISTTSRFVKYCPRSPLR